MTVADRPTGAVSTRRASGGVVVDIAARRLTDITPDLDALGAAGLARMAAAAPPPRDLVERLARPGLHLIAEVKRRSPSAGAIAGPDEDPVARARAYERGGASAISVLCEPHWFGGSIADLTAVRAAVGLPVLAKDFVVDPRQLPVIGINNRDLRTLDVDPERSARLRPLIPDDRIAVAESGVRTPATVAGWRALGFDAALVGEALMRSADPAAAARSFVHAGSAPSDPAAAPRRARSSAPCPSSARTSPCGSGATTTCRTRR